MHALCFSHAGGTVLTCPTNSVPYNEDDYAGPGCGVPGGWVDYWTDQSQYPTANIPFWWDIRRYGNFDPVALGAVQAEPSALSLNDQIASKSHYWNYGYWVRSVDYQDCKDWNSCLCQCFHSDGGWR